MAYVDVFNGDADGLCSLVQLRLAQPLESELITGVKRDTRLVRLARAIRGSCVTVLDLSFDKNREDVCRLLAEGVSVRYFDHHFAGDIPQHDRLEAVIDQSPDVCTSLLVNRYLGGRHVAWALVGAFGDNLHEPANALAIASGISGPDAADLRRLGELLNYNGYGARVDELHCHPAGLFRRLMDFPDPRGILKHCVEFRKIADGFESDLAAARKLDATLSNSRVAVYALPDASWARRAIGAWANEVSRAFPDRAHLFLCPDGEGTLSVSVRAPRSKPLNAAALCRRYPHGGGREAAAGINRLEHGRQDALVRDFVDTFG